MKKIQKIKWHQSRQDTQDFAYLEDIDLEDEFFMGLQVIEEENFLLPLFS